MKTYLVKSSILFVILLIINLLSDQYFYRWDLTKEKRNSISELSIQTVQNLKKIVTIKVYLEGDFPPSLERLSNAIRNVLYEMEAYADGNLHFMFIDPSDNKPLQKQFQEKGLIPIPLNIKEENIEARKYIYPFILINYDDREEWIDIFKNAYYPNGMANLIKAETDIEYKLVSAIRRISAEYRPTIGFLTGHHETPLKKMPELINELKNSYDIYEVNVKYGNAIPPSFLGLPDSLKKKYEGRTGLDVLLVIQPDSAFSEREKYEIDQYLMKGGKILWILDQNKVILDKQQTLSQPRQLNLDDLFFKYGFKINYDLLQDLSCGKIHLIADVNKQGGQFQSLNWIYYPMAIRFQQHPVTRNVDAVLYRYASTIDTLPKPNLKFTPLVLSSPLSRALKGNVLVDINEHTKPLPQNLFYNKGNQILGLLIEGQFQSVFQGREAPTDSFAKEKPTAPFLSKCKQSTAMIVLSDGQLVEKDDHPYIPYMPVDNKTLIQNAVDFLVGDEAITLVRAKEVEIRRLSKKAAKNYKLYIQIFNLVIPLILIVIFGVIRYIWRKKRYENF